MSNARVVELALALGALSIAQAMLVQSALGVAYVFVLFFADNLPELLLLRVHLAVVGRPWEGLLATESAGQTVDTGAYRQNHVETRGSYPCVEFGSWWGEACRGRLWYALPGEVEGCA